MCRNIKQLRYPDRPATDEELYEAALQYVRKISGYSRPSQVNQDAFEHAVSEIASASRQLLESLVVR